MTTAAAPQAPARSRWLVVVVLGSVALLLPFAGFFAGGVVGFLAPFPAGLVTWAVAFWLGAATLFAACWLATRAAGRHPETTTTRVLRGSLTVLAFVAPFAVEWASLAIIVASTATLAIGYKRKSLRGAAVVMTVYSLAAVVPVMIFMFLSVYGDPGADCVPI